MKSRYLRLEGEIPMVPWLASLIAVISSFLCLFLWFRDIRRIKGERRITMESAAGHLVAYRERTRKAQENPEVVVFVVIFLTSIKIIKITIAIKQM